MSNKIIILAIVTILTNAFVASAQEADDQIDSSKPTNFYPLLDNSLEFNSRRSGGNLMGYRAQLIYPPSEAHLFQMELPLLYNRGSKKFGLGDVRLRYFFLPYKNYDNFVGAFGPSIDVFAPTGSFKNGLGSSSWSLSPGLTAGLMIADWIQAFPIVSYSYVSKPTTDLIPEASKKERHGITAQALITVVFSEAFFMQVTPIWSLPDVKDSKTSRYTQEAQATYSVAPKLQLTAFYRGVFEDRDHTVRLGLTVFLL